MPAQEDYVFDPGVDYTVLFGGYASALNTGIQIAVPNSYRGMVAYTETQPQTVGRPDTNYPIDWYVFNKRGLWVTPSNGACYSFSGAAGSFVNVATQIPANTITNAMIQPGVIGLDKLSVVGGAPNYVIALDNTGAVLAYVDVIVSRADNSIPVAKLTASATNLQFVQTVGGVTVWADLTATQINTILAPSTGLLNTNALDVSIWNPLSIMRVNSSGTFVEFVDPGDLLQDNSIPITKLSPSTGQANKYLGVNASGTGVVYITPPTPPAVPTKATSGALTIPAASGSVSFTHALGATPTLVEVVFVCTVANNGYAIGDQLPYLAVSVGGGAETPAYQVKTTSTVVTLIQSDNTISAGRSFTNSTSGLLVAFVQAQWTAQITAVLIA